MLKFKEKIRIIFLSLFVSFLLIFFVDLIRPIFILIFARLILKIPFVQFGLFLSGVLFEVPIIIVGILTLIIFIKKFKTVSPLFIAISWWITIFFVDFLFGILLLNLIYYQPAVIIGHVFSFISIIGFTIFYLKSNLHK